MCSQKKLHIYLLDGFADDTVTVLVESKKVFHQSNITTRVQIGLAESFEMIIENPPVKVEIIISKRQLNKTVTIDGPWPVYLGVSVTQEGKIAHRVSQKPFYFL